MRKIFQLLFIFSFCVACSNENSFYVSKIIDGNTILLSNGITVDLLFVQDNQSNIKILEHYLKGKILLYDQNNDEITNFPSEVISAIIYNSDGDCINQLLMGITKITENKEPVIINNKIDDNKTIIKFDLENGVLKVPVIINGIEFYFIFDTGASLITISNNEANFLNKSGKLSKNDIVDKGQFTVANGDISEGTIINLKSVIIGNRELFDVKACVIEGQNAPLLLGQSALQKFGKVSIDYKNNEIIFE